MFCQLLTLECAALQSAGSLDNLSPLVLEIHIDASRYHFSVICLGKRLLFRRKWQHLGGEALLIDLRALFLTGGGSAALYQRRRELL